MLTKSVAEAALGFGIGNVQEATGAMMNMTYGLVKFMTKLLSTAFNITDPKLSAQASLMLLRGMKDDPGLQAIMKFTNALDVNILKKHNASEGN